MRFGVAALLAVVGSHPANAQNTNSVAISAKGSAQEAKRGLSAELRQRIETFLARRIRQEGIGADLLPIIMGRIDAEATGRSLSEKKRLYPDFKSYPSVAQQVRWQQSLNLIASEFSSAFPPDVMPLPESVETPRKPGEVKVPSTDQILWRIPKIISQSQGALGTTVPQAVLSSWKFGKGKARRHFARWTGPVMLSSTGQDWLDKRIQGEIDHIRLAASTGTTIELAGSRETANLFFPTTLSPRGSVDFVAFCLADPSCATLPALSSRTSSPGSIDTTDRSNFFDRLYLTNPYGHRSAASGLVELDTKGRLIGGFCGSMDIGYISSETRQYFAKGRLGYCLRELLSPGSGRHADTK